MTPWDRASQPAFAPFAEAVSQLCRRQRRGHGLTDLRTTLSSGSVATIAEGFDMTTGSCLCGGIQFQIQGQLEGIQVCYCGQCRKAQGTAMATNIPVSQDAFQLTRGSGLLKEFASSPGKLRVFCSACGSPIFSKTASRPGFLRIRAGTLDGDIDTRPVAHFHVASKASWWTICDELPQFPDAYTPSKGP